MADKIKITIDGVEHEVGAGENLLQACLDRDMLIPHFCYHEALGPAGACRQCAAMVAPAADKPARLEMTCMIRASEGMVISVNDEYSTKFRKQIIEDLMLNHPHDCPVCDEGGECMLQDMTVLTEHQHRRNRFPKRTWENQYLGPMIHHEMNRCITCYRCVRYYREYALGDDLGVFGSRDRVYFGRVKDGVLESEFSGNLVDVCPTGVFTNKMFREVYSRPWDLQTANSVCVNCSVGCNVLPGHRKDTLRRIKPLSNAAVNKFFMCDRGRYGGYFVNHESRLNSARVGGSEISLDAAIDQVSTQLTEIAKKHGPSMIAGIGSVRATLEANAALALLIKGVKGSGVSYFGTSAERAAVRRAAAITTSAQVAIAGLPEMENADFILNIGGDLTGEAPMIDLAVRQAIRKGASYFSVSPRAGKLDEFAKSTLRVAPGSEAAVVGQIAEGKAGSDDSKAFVEAVVAALAAARRPLILCSTLHGDVNAVNAAFNLAAKSGSEERKPSLAYYFSGANSLGVGLAKGDVDPDALLADINAGRIKAVVILERDIATEFAPAFAKALKKCELVVAIDSFENGTTQEASAVLPCVSHYQSFGTLVNYEGRAQRFEGLHIPRPVILASSEVLLFLVQKAGNADAIGGTDFHDIYDVKPEQSPLLDALKANSEGVLVRSASSLTAEAEKASTPAKAPWQVVHTFGSELLSALSPSVAELAPAHYIELHPDDAKGRNAAEGKELDLTKEFGVKGPVKLNPGLARGTVAVPLLFTSAARVRQEVTA